MGQSVVQVARLGMFIQGARQIDCAKLTTQALQQTASTARRSCLGGILVGALLVGSTIVEKPDLQFPSGIIHAFGGADRHRQNALILVVAGDEDVNGWQFCIVATRQWFAA